MQDPTEFEPIIADLKAAKDITRQIYGESSIVPLPADIVAAVLNAITARRLAKEIQTASAALADNIDTTAQRLANQLDQISR